MTGLTRWFRVIYDEVIAPVYNLIFISARPPSPLLQDLLTELDEYSDE